MLDTELLIQYPTCAYLDLLCFKSAGDLLDCAFFRPLLLPGSL